MSAGTSPGALYLDLLKKTLTFGLWPEPPVPLMTFNYRRPRLTRALVAAGSRLLGTLGLEVVKHHPRSAEQRHEGRGWPVYADTMIGVKRLDNLQACIETVLRDGIPGDLIETGVWRGGACIFMRGVLAAHGVTDRRVYVADSFAGLPPPDPAHAADRNDRHHEQRFLVVSLDQVRRNFERYGLLDEQVVFVEGFFSEALPRADIDRLAVLRLDGDMYGSTIDALNVLYPKLASGGFCIIDDLALSGCRKAVEDYRAKHGIETDIVKIDWTSGYWRKA